MAFPINTNVIPLFGSSGQFYAQASISAKKINNKQFTVTVDGVRAYSKYGWNFTTHLEVRLATDSAGSGGVSDTGSIAKSYNNYYTGWLPKSDYNDSATVTKTFNYNNDGSIPSVYLYLRAYNGSVYYINAGTDVYVDCKYHGDIKDTIKSAIELDTSAVDFGLRKTHENSREIGFVIDVNIHNTNSAKKWYIQLDEGDIETTTEGFVTRTYEVSNGLHKVTVISENEYGVQVTKSLDFDTTLPLINKCSLIPVSINKANFTLKYTSNCSKGCNWSLSGENMTTITGSNQVEAEEVTIASGANQLYTLTLTRVDNSSLSVTTPLYCNTIIPKLKIKNLYSVANNIYISVESDIPCKDWEIEVITKDDSTTQTTHKNEDWDGDSEINFIISNLDLETPYIIKVKATNNVTNGLTTVIDSSPITCQGCVYIGDKLASPMIYNSNKKQWVGAIPYIYDENYNSGDFPENDLRNHWRKTIMKKNEVE